MKEQSTLKTPKNQLPHSNNLQSYFTKESGQRTIFPKEEQHLCEEDSAFENAHFAESSEPQESSLLQQSIESKNPSGKKGYSIINQISFLLCMYRRFLYVEKVYIYAFS